jgi:hypothetical protein
MEISMIERLADRSAVEEADASDACGSRSDAGRGIFQCDTAECQYRYGSGGGAGAAELVETAPRAAAAACDDFLEDRSKEDTVYAVIAGASDLGQSMAGDRNHGWGKSCGGEEVAYLLWSEFARGGGEVHSMGSDRDRDVGAGVDEKLRTRGEGFEEVAGEFGESRCRKVLFAELDEVDAGGSPSSGLFD